MAYASEEISFVVCAPALAERTGPQQLVPVKTAYGEKTIFGHKKRAENPPSRSYVRSARVFEYKQKNIRKNKENTETSFYIVESEKCHTSPRRRVIIIINSKLVYRMTTTTTSDAEQQVGRIRHRGSRTLL